MSNKKLNPNLDTIYQIYTNDVLQELESRKYIEEIFGDIILDVKKSPAYVRLKSIALLHFTSIMSDESESQPSRENIAKKKTQTSQIGFLSDAIGSTITKLVSEKLQFLETDIHTVVMEIIEQLQIELFESNKDVVNSTGESSSSETSKVKISALPTVRGKKSSEDSDTGNFSPTKRSKRIKRPNLKYFSKDIVSPVACMSSAEGSSESSDENSGRKKKKMFKKT